MVSFGASEQSELNWPSTKFSSSTANRINNGKWPIMGYLTIEKRLFQDLSHGFVICLNLLHELMRHLTNLPGYDNPQDNMKLDRNLSKH